MPSGRLDVFIKTKTPKRLNGKQKTKRTEDKLKQQQ